MRLLLAFFLFLLPALASAQATATLVADSVTVTADKQLIAEGNVQVFYDGTRLSAYRITYDQTGDRLTIDGPILIVSPEGTILSADRADLDPQLENGLLRGARLVLDQQLQLAANDIERVDGQYSAMRQVAATSCQVCGNRPPLWEIRTASVIYDEAEKQIYFKDSTFLIRGVPVFWLPQMRLPDPTLERATGFLIPSIVTTDQLGFGVRVPYFLTFGPSRDLTLIPYVSPQTRTLEYRYRQAFALGDMNFTGAISQDSLQPGETRGYLFADGGVDLGNDYQLGILIEAVTDPSYLLDYNFSDQDRLNSGVRLTRVQDFSLLRADITYYQTLRADEENERLPPLVGEWTWEHRYTPDQIGGILTLSSGAQSFYSPGVAEGPDGLDMVRFGGTADWQNDWILPAGFLAQAAGRLDGYAYAIANDPGYDSFVTQASPAVAVTLRWPLIRSSDGASNVIEPMAALGWNAVLGGDVPNEDSTLVEFDQANLFALTRFPGLDAHEFGTRATLGLNWTRVGRNGTESTMTFGRIWRSTVDDQFTTTSGLQNKKSDWLVAGQFDLSGGFSLNARTILNPEFDLSRTEARLDWANPIIAVGAAYIFLPPDDAEDRPAAVSEWTVDAAYEIDERWEIRASGRYNVAVDEPAYAGLGVGWRNECVTVDLSLFRRYTSSTIVDPTTSLGLSVNLNGFSAGRSDSAAAGTCRG
ncbi:MAG: LPS assembly protein LptD [Rhodobacterales bacterium]|nr:LPS assembly protein LptD [Rhodobacterales bacterium]